MNKEKIFNEFNKALEAYFSSAQGCWVNSRSSFREGAKFGLNFGISRSGKGELRMKKFNLKEAKNHPEKIITRSGYPVSILEWNTNNHTFGKIYKISGSINGTIRYYTIDGRHDLAKEDDEWDLFLIINGIPYEGELTLGDFLNIDKKNYKVISDFYDRGKESCIIRQENGEGEYIILTRNNDYWEIKE